MYKVGDIVMFTEINPTYPYNDSFEIILLDFLWSNDIPDIYKLRGLKTKHEISVLMECVVLDTLYYRKMKLKKIYERIKTT